MEPECEDPWDGYEEEAERIERAKPALVRATKYWWIFGLWTIIRYAWVAFVRRMRIGPEEAESIIVFTHAGRSVYRERPKAGVLPFCRHTHIYDIKSKRFRAHWRDDGKLEVFHADAER